MSDLSAREFRSGPSAVGPATAFRDYAAVWRLDVLDRLLLLGDGTVTTLLELCLGRPIATRTTRQSGPARLETLVAESGTWWHPDAVQLGLAAGQEVVARRSILSEQPDGPPYVLAETLLVPDRLPPEVTGALSREGSSIGRVINGNSIESRRELVQMGQMRAGEASDYLVTEPGATLLWRTYRIMVRGRPAMLITEMIVPGRLSASARDNIVRWMPTLEASQNGQQRHDEQGIVDTARAASSAGRRFKRHSSATRPPTAR